MANAEASTPVIKDPEVVILKDAAGGYYLLPAEMLEQGRVPEEHTVDVERLLAEVLGDVSGYVADLSPTQAIHIGARLMLSGDLAVGRAFLEAGFLAAGRGWGVNI